MAGLKASRIITKDELCLLERVPPSCGIIIFGASGDLAHRKLYPSLITLLRDKVLPKNYYVLGTARTEMTDEAFRKNIREKLDAKLPADLVQSFLERCYYVSGDYGQPALYQALKTRLAELDKKHDTGARHLFYLSVPPTIYEKISEQLGQSGLSRSGPEDQWTRVVVEKPFGSNLATAKHLNDCLHKHFQEKQIYRIDHYLGKETVQNILMFRFANAIFEPVWNHHYIDNIQITAAETDGVGHRAGYYEQAGVVRDMFQNHLLQLLSLVAMEPPSSFAPNAVRDEKSKVIASLKSLSPAELDGCSVRGQYKGYRQEKGVKPDSTIETFAALRVEVDNWRWQNTPFFLRSGKKLKTRETEILVEFKHVPTSIFKPLMAEQMSANVLRFAIQPDEGIQLSFEAKHPGPKLCMSTVTMQFDYSETFGTEPPESYARLFLDVMLGDPTLFARQDWLTGSWRFIDPLLDRWKEQKDKGLLFYEPGSTGPAEADALLQRDGCAWK